MNKIKNTIPVLVAAILLSIAIPAHLYAQEAADSAYHYSDEDTLIYPPQISDSAISGYDSSSDSYQQDDAEILYFLQKSDTTSLYDSSVAEWRAVPDSVVTALKKDGAFWYANKDMEKKTEDTEGLSWLDKILIGLINLLANPVFRRIIWFIIIGGFAAAVIWFLLQNQMNIFGVSRKTVIVRKTEAEASEDVFSTDLENAAREAATQGNFRMAIRFQYLHLLKIFSQQELLQYRPDATNYDYLKQLFDRPYYKDFFRVTRNYEYAWYGEMTVSKDQYEVVHKEFNDLYQKALTNH